MTHFNKTLKTIVSVSALATVVTLSPAYAQSPFSWYNQGEQAQTDQALSEANVQIKYDGLHAVPQLNIGLESGDVVATKGTAVTFQTFWNYGAFINRAEVRVFSADQSVRDERALFLPVQNGVATLPAGNDLSGDLIYVLRVYGHDGRFDETEAKPLTLIDREMPEQINTILPQKLSGYGIDRTALRNINVKGASVTVFGRDIDPNGRVSVMGSAVPIDSNGSFAVQKILPFGEHAVDIDVSTAGRNTNFVREIALDGTEFFYVAIGDLTLGTNSSDGPADFLASSDEDLDDVNVYGRGALYMKGRVNGDYLVTAAIDTGEDRIEDLFSNLDEKDPSQLLRRLNSDRFYPVYGDDSTLVEDAPTQGRFYVRVERDDSHVMWGNFATQITGTEFAQLDRGLYGGVLDYNSEAATSFGERDTQITAFAADPGTLPAREEFRGTGGSVYFLERQDLSIGSERLRVEVRDKVSGLVVESRELLPQEDYDIDYIQGRILLSNALQSTASDTQIVRDGALSGNDVYLVARYEYSPSLDDVDGYTLGGRATQWLGDVLRIGATAQNEQTGAADQTLYGLDALVRHSAGTYLKAEVAQTEGPGFSQSSSTDGGFNFATLDTQGQANQTALAYRVEAAADLSDLSNLRGRAIAYYDHQDSGFSGSNRLVEGEVDRYGLSLSMDVFDATTASVQFDQVDAALRGKSSAVYADVTHQFNDTFKGSLGVRHDNSETVASGLAAAVTGTRTDVSAQLDYIVSPHSAIYGFAQGTVASDATRQNNNRYGVGADFQLNDRMSLNGEVSNGDGGVGANAQVSYTRSDNSEFYLGYALSADRTDTGFATQTQSLANYGTLTFGGRTRYSDSLSVYGEERFGYGQNQSSLSHVYGLTFNPSEVWSFGANIENGVIEDDVYGDFDRKAFGVSVGVANENVRIASNLEARYEDGVLTGSTRDRETILMRNTFSWDADEDWEMLGRFNFAKSKSDESDFVNADFIEGVLGAAYRPIENDRLNALIKYTYYEDLAPASQISSSGETGLARQKSQIFSIDGIYDLTEKLSIGAKYGMRSGEVALDRTSDDYVESSASLGVIRLDYHVVKQWDIMAEARMLASDLADDSQFGALIGVYRHLGDNAKIGVGYNFTEFSDDLRDFDSNSEGFFINMVGKF